MPGKGHQGNKTTRLSTQSKTQCPKTQEKLPGKGDQGPGAPYNAAAKFYRVYTDSIEGEPDVRVSHIGIDRKHTTAADVNSYFPLAQLKIAAEEGRIGELSNRFIGTPTNRSQVVTIEQDCADVLAELRKDGVEAAVIVAA